ncbi:hypothetical protein IAD21_00479 [Abditibacteriota bacterium]|nr:hypothetical protein IAD21_00479 [Abditibacteriota bacterium]
MNTLLEQIQRDIGQNYYADNFSNDGQRFLAWYLRNIHLRTPIQTRDDITDGANDKGIDAIIIDDEKRQVFVIQGKFFSSSSVDHEPLHEILGAWHQIQNIHSLQANANSLLQVKLEAVAEALREDYEIVFELVTTGVLSNPAQDDLKVFQEQMSEVEHPSVSLTVVDAPMLQVRWDEALNHDPEQLSHTFTLSPGHYLSLEVARFRTVLAAIPLADCLQIPGIRSGAVFRRNVRQSLGLTNKVNKGLKQTINSEAPNSSSCIIMASRHCARA